MTCFAWFWSPASTKHPRPASYKNSCDTLTCCPECTQGEAERGELRPARPKTGENLKSFSRGQGRASSAFVKVIYLPETLEPCNHPSWRFMDLGFRV